MSLVLRLLGRDHDPARSREHVLLSVFAEHHLREGNAADLGTLLHDLSHPPVSTIGALDVDSFLPKTERKALAAALNSLMASPTFASWRQGATMDVGCWLAPTADGRTPAVIVSVAHLDDEERALVLGVLFEEVLAWTRSLSGSRRLRALCVFDEVYGFVPPHPANPPTKRPMVALMNRSGRRLPESTEVQEHGAAPRALKRARAFGVGVVLATQNPMDLDYRALGNAGLWCIGRLQTDADRARVVDGLAGSAGADGATVHALDETVKRLGAGWFVVRDAHAEGLRLMQPRWAMSFLKGPMTRAEMRRAIGGRGPGISTASSPETSLPSHGGRAYPSAATL